MKIYNKNGDVIWKNANIDSLSGADLRGTYLSGSDLRGAKLRGAWLIGSNLSGADLSETDLTRAKLSESNLSGTYLRGADLRGAKLRGAWLIGSNLSGSDLRGADLREALLIESDLTRAKLSKTDLSETDLTRAKLSGSDLRGTDLSGADLKDTVLDPNAKIPELIDEEITAAGLEIVDDKVYGWRTKVSQHAGNTVYVIGKCYEAPIFSVCTDTECHPGIYLDRIEYIKNRYNRSEIVRVYCLRSELVHARKKWRAKRIWVIGEDNENL